MDSRFEELWDVELVGLMTSKPDKLGPWSDAGIARLPPHVTLRSLVILPQNQDI